MNSKGLEAKDNNYLTAVLTDGNQFGFAYVDLSTGELKQQSWLMKRAF